MALDPTRVLAAWRRLAPLPGGRRLFAFLLARGVRYTGSIRPRVVALAPGRVAVEMRDRAAVRNHLGSIHAVALANLAEVSSGLALLAGLPADARAILVKLEVDYLKKARGTLRSECDFAPVTTADEREIDVVSRIVDAAGDVVATGRARWKIGRARPRAAA